MENIQTSRVGPTVLRHENKILETDQEIIPVLENFWHNKFQWGNWPSWTAKQERIGVNLRISERRKQKFILEISEEEVIQA